VVVVVVVVVKVVVVVVVVVEVVASAAFSQRKPGFTPRFVADKVAVGQVSAESFGFPL
jgi:hypothetical protein